MRQPRTAVILAAGLGSRLGDLKEEKPKAFVKIGGTELIHRSVRQLIAQGIKSIIIGTGYRNEYFDELRNEYPEVKTFRNERYAETGSMYTLYVLQHLIDGPILLLEGDLLYESKALEFLLSDSRENIILASTATHSGDEVFIQSNSEGLLQKMSKDKNQLKNVDGELVGICKLSAEALSLMFEHAKGTYSTNQYQMHYEDTLVGVSDVVDLHVRVEDDLAWCEIDDGMHLKRAIEHVYPKIQLRS